MRYSATSRSPSTQALRLKASSGAAVLHPAPGPRPATFAAPAATGQGCKIFLHIFIELKRCPVQVIGVARVYLKMQDCRHSRVSSFAPFSAPSRAALVLMDIVCSRPCSVLPSTVYRVHLRQNVCTRGDFIFTAHRVPAAGHRRDRARR